MPDEALTSFTVYMTHIAIFARQGIGIEVRKYRSRLEYLIPTNNIIVLDKYFNLMNKSNLIDRL